MGKNEETSLTVKVKEQGKESIDDIGKAFSKVKDLALGLGAALVGVFTKAVMDFKESEEATKRLTQAMVNAGTYSSKLKDEYKAQAEALAQVTTFDDDAIVSGQAVAQQYLKNTVITKDLTKAILDYAAGEGIEVAQAAEKVGKAIGTSTNALAKQGIQLSANMSQQERMTAVIDGLNGRYKDQSTTLASGLGIIEQLFNQVGELSEELGERLAPAITFVARDLLGLARDGNTTGQVMDFLSGTFEVLMRGGYAVAFAFESLGATIGGVLGTAIGTITQLVEGNFKQAAMTLTQGIDGIGQERVAIEERYNAKVLELDELFMAKKTENVAKEAELVRQAEENKTRIRTEADEVESIRALTKQQEDFALKMQLKQANHEMELAQLATNDLDKQSQQNSAEQASLNAQIAYYQKQATNAATQHDKLKNMRKVADLQKQLDEKKMTEFDLQEQKIREQNQEATFSKIASLQRSNNQALATVGKAAALTQIAIQAPQGIAMALGAFPPPANFIAAAAVGAAFAAQASEVAGIPLAEGGVVRARPGGIQATIGEGGQDEAVIPLDRAGEFMGGGGGNTFNFYGPVMGDDTQAREFALKVDKELLKLRQNNESVAFDSGVI